MRKVTFRTQLPINGQNMNCIHHFYFHLLIFRYFGLTIQINGTNSNITLGEFQQFLDAEVTPKFPSGLSWKPVNGQYNGSQVLLEINNKVQPQIFSSFY
jgi:hypothetical protein